MPEIEEAQSPRGSFGKTTWIILGVGLFAGIAGVLAFVGSVSGSRNHVQPPPMPGRRVQTESPRTVASVAADVNKQVDSQPANTPPGYSLPPPPARQQGQDNGAAEYWRQVRDRRQQELGAPIMGIPPQWMMQQVQEQRPQAAGVPEGTGDPQLMQAMAALGAAGIDAGGTRAGFPVGYNSAAYSPGGRRVISGETSRRPDDFSVQSGASNRWVGPLLKIFHGTTIHTTLDDQIQSDIPGFVSCTVSSPVLSFDHQHVLIPEGSKVYGQTGRVEMAGQHRLGIAFESMVLPNGGEIALANLPAKDEKGSNGVADKTNNHTLRLFATSLAMSLIGAGAEVGALGPLNGNGVDELRYGFAAGMSNAGMQTLSRLGNIPPSITIRKGHPVDVFLVGDLNLPSYPAGWRMDPHL